MTSFEMQTDTQYAIVIKTSETGANDNIRIRGSKTGIMDGGEALTSSDSGSTWSAEGGVDWGFKIKGAYTNGRKIFKGLLEEVKFQGKETTQQVVLSGRDYTATLMDATVPPTVFNNSDITTIVSNLVTNYAPDIDASEITTNTGVTLSRIVFAQETLYDALRSLAEKSSFRFFIDVEKKFIWKALTDTPSAVGSTTLPVIKMNSTTNRQEMANSIWVYGDRQLIGVKEVNNNNGSIFGGSIFNLLYKPHNTRIQSSSSPNVVLKGDILGITQSATSGADYFVDFHSRNIVFASGTDIGYSTIPASGGSIISEYQRSVPIVKFGEDRNSVAAYGRKSKVITDKNIKDPSLAIKILNDELEKSNPFNRFEAQTAKWDFVYYDILNKTVTLDMSNFGVDDLTTLVIGIDYKFDKNTIQDETAVTLKLDNKLLDVTDSLRNLKVRVDNLEAVDRQDTDVITRLETATGSMLVVGSYWTISTKPINDSFILSKSKSAVLGVVDPNTLGTIVGTDYTWVSGNIGTGYNKAINLQDKTNITTNSMDWSGTINTDKVTMAGWMNGSFGPGFGSSISDAFFGIYVQDETPGIGFKSGTTTGYRLFTQAKINNSNKSINSASNLLDNETGSWFHTAFRFNGTDVSLWYNGSNLGSVSATGSVAPFANRFRLGLDDNNRYFYGLYNDIRYYNRGLSDAEIGSLYNKQNVNGSLLLHWKLDEGSGTAVYSSASGGNSVIQPFLGNRRGALSIQTSGGYY